LFRFTFIYFDNSYAECIVFRIANKIYVYNKTVFFVLFGPYTVFIIHTFTIQFTLLIDNALLQCIGSNLVLYTSLYLLQEL